MLLNELLKTADMDEQIADALLNSIFYYWSQFNYWEVKNKNIRTTNEASPINSTVQSARYPEKDKIIFENLNYSEETVLSQITGKNEMGYISIWTTTNGRRGADPNGGFFRLNRDTWQVYDFCIGMSVFSCLIDCLAKSVFVGFGMCSIE